MPACHGSQDCCSQCPWLHSRPLSTHASTKGSGTCTGKSGSVLWSPCSFPESWCAHVFFVSSKSLFPQSCACSVISPTDLQSQIPGNSQSIRWIPWLRKWLWFLGVFAAVWEFLWYNCSPVCELSAQQLYGGANGDLLQEDWCHMPNLLGVLQPEPLPPWQGTADSCLHRRHSNTLRQVWVSCRSHCSFPWVLVCRRFCLCIRGISGGYEVWLNMIVPFLPSCWGSSFALGCRVSLFGGIQHSPVDGCSAASWGFVVLTGEDEHMSFYSAIFPGSSAYRIHLQRSVQFLGWKDLLEKA